MRPNSNRVVALSHMPLPTDIKQLRSLLGDLSYYRKFLPNTARRICSIIHTALLKSVEINFTYTMEDTARALLMKSTKPPILVFPDCDADTDKSFIFCLHCDSSTAGVGGTLEKELYDGSVRPH